METTRQTAQVKVQELLSEAFSGARVFQGGGSEVLGADLQTPVFEAAKNALRRLYPQFDPADHPAWDKVYDKARQGAPDALKAVGDEGKVGNNPVCKAILAFIGAGKTGADVRTHFEDPPYGWSRDAVDGGLQVLLVAGSIRGQDDRGQSVVLTELERKAIGKTTFRVESATITAQQRIAIRKIFQMAGVNAVSGEESAAVPKFLETMTRLAARSGGEAPKPEPSDTTSLETIRLASGNEQLLLIYNLREELKTAFNSWQDLADRIETRWPNWEKLQNLLRHAGDLKTAQDAPLQAQAIRNQRLLLDEPDLVVPLFKSVEDALRNELTSRRQEYADTLDRARQELDADEAWQQLVEDEQNAILNQAKIAVAPQLTLGTHQELLAALEEFPLRGWRDRIDALSGRFVRVRELAARALKPETMTMDLPRRILKSTQDVDDWIHEVREELNQAVAKGPVLIR